MSKTALSLSLRNKKTTSFRDFGSSGLSIEAKIYLNKH
jgi:hypothetical protein